MPHLLYDYPFYRAPLRHEDLWRQQKHAKLQRARQLEEERERQRLRAAYRQHLLDERAQLENRRRLEQQRAALAERRAAEAAYRAKMERRDHARRHETEMDWRRALMEERERKAEMERHRVLAEERVAQMERRRALMEERERALERLREEREARMREAEEHRRRQAATLLQAAWRGRESRRAAILPGLRQLRALEDSVWAIRDKYAAALRARTEAEDAARFWRAPQSGPYQKEILGYEDELMRQILRIDGILSNGSAVLRQRRKDVVALVQSLLRDQVDALKFLSERLAHRLERIESDEEQESDQSDQTEWELESTEESVQGEECTAAAAEVSVDAAEQGEEERFEADVVLSWLEMVFGTGERM